MEVLVEGLRAEMARCCGDEADTAHFVTHSMGGVATRLENAGFRVVNFGYPSTSEPMEVLVEGLRAEMARCCGDEADTAHFVTHSMGECWSGAICPGRQKPTRDAS